VTISDILWRAGLLVLGVVVVALLALAIAAVTSESRSADEDYLRRIVSCRSAPSTSHPQCVPVTSASSTTTTTTT
jgi:hypothetical protein